MSSSSPPPPAPAPSGVDLPTLVVTAIASALAAFICSKVWAPGTLASAATTPVLVAIGKELLRKPTEVVTTVVPPVPTGRLRRRTAGPDEPTAVHQPGSDLPEPAIVAVRPPAVETSTSTPRQLHWRVAVITGLLGFALCAAVITLPELLTKGSGTTLFGGGGSSTKVIQRTVTTTTSTVQVPGRTVTTTAPTTTATTPAPTTTAPATVTTTTTETAPPTVTETVTTPATTPPQTTSTDSSSTEPVDPLP